MEYTLKHTWNDSAAEVIKALKHKLRTQPFVETDDQHMVVFQRALQRVLKRYNDNKTFFQLWEDIPLELKSVFRYGSVEMWKICLCQSLIAVFTKQDPISHNAQDTVKFLSRQLFEDFKRAQLPQLPERLPDKNLLEAARNGDTAKIIFLYDSAVNPGQKMKNITNVLLNKQYYETLMQLHSVYGCLDVVDTVYLYFYHLHTAKEVLPGKEAFDRYCLARFSGEDETFWGKSFIYGTLDKLLIPALESGADSEKALWKFDKYTFPLRGCLLFFDELQEEFDAIYKIGNVISLLNAARKFTEWEEKNSPQR
ncbi:MAG: hypothetical protein IKB99_01495 [Lentisphaeria bacterium]|nr:hypothetical protein [Lentisphaeria bacterium]